MSLVAIEAEICTTDRTTDSSGSFDVPCSISEVGGGAT